MKSDVRSYDTAAREPTTGHREGVQQVEQAHKGRADHILDALQLVQATHLSGPQARNASSGAPLGTQTPLPRARQQLLGPSDSRPPAGASIRP